MTKTLGGFKVTVEEGSFTDSEIIVMLGENGTGKTTFVRLLAGEEPDNPTDKQSMAVSLKPQTISPKFPGSVRILLLKQIKAAFMNALATALEICLPPCSSAYPNVHKYT